MNEQDHDGVKAGLGVILLLGVTACSARDPIPSARYDGRYLGERWSDQTKACGAARTHGVTSADVVRGHLTMPLYGPKSLLRGTVGEDGTVRASGMWPNPTGGFPGETVLNGMIRDDVLAGTASDFRCHTDVRLRKIAPKREVPGKTTRRVARQ